MASASNGAALLTIRKEQAPVVRGMADFTSLLALATSGIAP
jgi:hypothetical protein